MMNTQTAEEKVNAINESNKQLYIKIAPEFLKTDKVVEYLDKLGYFKVPNIDNGVIGRPGSMFSHCYNVYKTLYKYTKSGLCNWGDERPKDANGVSLSVFVVAMFSRLYLCNDMFVWDAKNGKFVKNADYEDFRDYEDHEFKALRILKYLLGIDDIDLTNPEIVCLTDDPTKRHPEKEWYYTTVADEYVHSFEDKK